VVYALRDPRNKDLRYVGLTKDAHARSVAHLTLVGSGNPHLVEWKEELFARGLLPEFVVLGKPMEDGCSEDWWIENAAKFFPLVNVNAGNSDCALDFKGPSGVVGVVKLLFGGL